MNRLGLLPIPPGGATDVSPGLPLAVEVSVLLSPLTATGRDGPSFRVPVSCGARGLWPELGFSWVNLTGEALGATGGGRDSSDFGKEAAAGCPALASCMDISVSLSARTLRRALADTSLDMDKFAATNPAGKKNTQCGSSGISPASIQIVPSVGYEAHHATLLWSVMRSPPPP